MAGSSLYGRGHYDARVEMAGAVARFVKSQQRASTALLVLAIAAPIVVGVGSVLIDIRSTSRAAAPDPDTDR